MACPSPLARACSRAACTALAAYRPVNRSATATPTFIGSAPGVPSGWPVTDIRPPSAWIM